MQGHLLGFSWAKCDAIKGRQCAHGELYAFWTLLRCIQVDLGNLVADQLAGILYSNGNAQAMVRRWEHAEVGVVEAAVGEPKSKGKSGLDILLVEPAIADVQAFREGCFAFQALGGALRVSGVGGGIILEALGPRERESPGGVHFA